MRIGKNGYWRAWWLPTLLLGFSSLFPHLLTAQTGVLQLDGEGDYVELPAGAFTSLESATIEAWVKWDEFQPMSRVFALTLRDRKIVNLMNRSTTPTLWSEHFHSGSRSSVVVSNVLSSNEWVHLAVVVEPEASALYLNGVLMTDQVTTGADNFRSDEFSRFNFLGRGNAKSYLAE